MNGTTSRSEIRSVLAEIAPRYDGVRITTFVPIFLRKDVCRRLQSGPRHYQAVGASGTSGTSGKDADSVREDATATPQATDEPAPTEESTEERAREPANG